ncbi:MAG TPA: arginine--tRNA ligase [bacterium]|nr:arginine--tRNA ligase [bacterium]
MIADKLRQNILKILLEENIGLDNINSYFDVPLETPKNKAYGHYSCNIPFMLAKLLKKSPFEIATDFARKLDDGSFEKIEAVKPGFINFSLKNETLQNVIPEIIENGNNYGKSAFGGGKKIQVEFVSANPTGPLSVGHGRIAAFGDTLANILSEAGFDTQKEFYVNDAGNQINNLTDSVELRAKELLGQEIDPEQLGYKGEYLIDTAKALLEEYGESILGKEAAERKPIIAEFAIRRMLEAQKLTLRRFGVVYDEWFREHVLHQQGLVQQALDILTSRDEAYVDDDAYWFRSTKYNDEKDRVLKKSDGTPTYFLADIAYHNNKYQRGFDTVIDVWGADHHGYIDRMKSAIQALGYDENQLEVLIIQFVRFKESDEYVKMSKRAGTMITIDDLIDHVGEDVARFFFLTRSRESHLDFDLELAGEKSEANPLFYLQYAHARICSLIEKGKENGIETSVSGDFNMLTHDRELQLMKRLADYPWEIQSAAAAREPHRIIAFLTELAGDFHSFYHDVRVVSQDEAEISSTRLALCFAVKTVMANGLRLLGVSAPESM